MKVPAAAAAAYYGYEQLDGVCQVLCSTGNVDNNYNDCGESIRRHHLRLHVADDDGNVGGPGSHATAATAAAGGVDGCDGLVH